MRDASDGERKKGGVMAKRKRPVDGMQRRYEWRLYPTPEQMAALREQAAMCADL